MAIVISSDLVFSIFRFRVPVVAGESSGMRKGARVLWGVLALLSVPLITTLVMDIQKVKLHNRIERIMKAHLDRQATSRLTACSFHDRGVGLAVTASVNTISYYEIATEKELETELSAALQKPVELELEQVIVKSWRVNAPAALVGAPVASPPVPEGLGTLQKRITRRIREACDDLRPYFHPYPITQCSVRLSEQKPNITVLMTIARDDPFSDSEQRWLTVALTRALGEPMALELETVAFLPPMGFGTDGTLDEVSRNALRALQGLAEDGAPMRILVTAPKAQQGKDRPQSLVLAQIKDYLVKDLGLSAEDIARGPDHGATFNVKVKRKLEPARQSW